MKNASNYVENEYIYEIQVNNSRCLKAFPDLNNSISKYLNDLNNSISEYLNETNLTDFEDYLDYNCSSEGIIDALISNNENDTCLNITQINSTFYSEEIDLILDCQNNSDYNYTYVILENFEKEDKDNLDEYISNIIAAVKSNIIDENYIFNYVENNTKKNTSLEINITDYKIDFEDIEDLNFYINNLREPEYKNLINNILIDSFNASYENNVNVYLINETINKINILVNYKFDIFIDYFTKKLSNDAEYYLFLLDSISELGNSSKTAIINLFSNIPHKLNESIYYLIEDDIFYYIDMFFRENKNIFSENFIKFYIEDVKNYNISLYKIENYTEELMLNGNFNKSLNNISLFLFNEIKEEIKENIKNSIYSKLNTFINNCNEISNNISIKLQSINTSELPSDMENLIRLINNYSSLVENQNNRYNFTFGDGPFNLLKNFTDEELQPPLQLIYDKYNSIEEDLINRTREIVENFPDCFSLVKENLIGNKTEMIDNFTNQINLTLLEYKNLFNEDIERYINKLIHFIYIDGLNTMAQSCENSYCGINKKYSLRNLEQKNEFNLANKLKIENDINKNIIFKNKRKLASLPEYSSEMGALSESDVLYYLSDLLNTSYKLNKTYFGREYYNVNITTNKFLLKVNFLL